MAVDKSVGMPLRRVPRPSHVSFLSAIVDIAHKEKQRALCMLDGVVDVTHDYRGGVFLLCLPCQRAPSLVARHDPSFRRDRRW